MQMKIDEVPEANVAPLMQTKSLQRTLFNKRKSLNDLKQPEAQPSYDADRQTIRAL